MRDVSVHIITAFETQEGRPCQSVYWLPTGRAVTAGGCVEGYSIRDSEVHAVVVIDLPLRTTDTLWRAAEAVLICSTTCRIAPKSSPPSTRSNSFLRTTRGSGPKAIPPAPTQPNVKLLTE